jgi:hypothetical protein
LNNSNKTVLDINFPEETLDHNKDHAFNNKNNDKMENSIISSNKNINKTHSSKKLNKNKASTTTPASTNFISSSINTKSYMGKLVLNKNSIVYQRKYSKDSHQGLNFHDF